MSKKSFKGGLNSLLGSEEKPGSPGQEPKSSPGRGRPRTNFKKVQKSSQEGTKEGETRATFILKEDSLDKLKAIAYWDRKKIKQVTEEAIALYIGAWEKKQKKQVPPIPED